MRKPLEFLACIPLPWVLYRFAAHHRNYPDAVVIAGTIPMLFAIVFLVRQGHIDRLLKTVLTGIALCYAVISVLVHDGLWLVWGSAWSAVMGTLFLGSLAVRRPVFRCLLADVPEPYARKSSFLLTAIWGMAFLFDGGWRLWSRHDWPFEHFLAAAPAVSYMVMIGLVVWSFWYTDQTERIAAA
jgi:hypothetical protein